jgi:hypothetical protein
MELVSYNYIIPKPYSLIHRNKNMKTIFSLNVDVIISSIQLQNQHQDQQLEHFQISFLKLHQNPYYGILMQQFFTMMFGK